MTTDYEIKAELEVLIERYFYGNLFLRTEKRVPRKLKKRIRNKGMVLTTNGLKAI